MDKVEFNCDFGILTRPDGSSMFAEGETVAIAALYGPVEAKMQKVLIDKANVECHYRPKAGLPGVEDRFYEALIRNICETALVASLYPRSSVIAVIQETQNCGRLVSCAINALCLACLDSGIDMKFMFCAVSCFINKEEELLFVAPISENDIKASFVFVFENVMGRVLATNTEGSFTREQFEQALQLSREESKNVFLYFKKSLPAIT